MNKVRLTYFILLICSFVITKGQQIPNGRLADGGTSIPSNIVTNRIDNFYTGDKLLSEMNLSTKVLKFDNIEGSPFWSDKWMYASLYSYKNEFLAKVPVNLNFANGQLYAKVGDSVLQLDNETVRKVVVYSDTSKNQVKAVFLSFLPYVYIGNEKINDYLEVFYSGYAILLKYKKKVLAQSESGGGMSKFYYFKDFSYYYLQVNNKIERITSLSKEQLFQLLPGSNNLDSWVKEKKLNLKKENDVIQFIEYYNSIKEKEVKSLN